MGNGGTTMPSLPGYAPQTWGLEFGTAGLGPVRVRSNRVGDTAHGGGAAAASTAAAERLGSGTFQGSHSLNALRQPAERAGSAPVSQLPHLARFGP